MLRVTVDRHSSQDVAMAKALTNGHALKVAGGPEGTVYGRAVSRDWAPQSRHARYVIRLAN